MTLNIKSINIIKYLFLHLDEGEVVAIKVEKIN